MSEQIITRTIDFYLALVDDFTNVADDEKERGQFDIDLEVKFITRKKGIKIDLTHRVPHINEKEVYASVILNDEQAFEFLALFTKALKEKYGNQLDINRELGRGNLHIVTYNFYFSKES